MQAAGRTTRMRLRTEESVKPLELFFDLVFVLAITQCTVAMADDPTWEGIARGLLVLGVLWWSWVGYSWLTSVVDPEEGIVRFAIFGAMAALLVVALCVPEAFGDLGLLFAWAYFVVRVGQVILLYSAARDDPGFRRSVSGLAVGTLIGTSVLIGASFADGVLQGGLWALALALDVSEPYLFGSEGWRLAPHHFAERHGLIIIIALGESIVSIGTGVEAEVDAGVVVAAALGVGLASALWWLYFDVVALVVERRLADADPGRIQNEIARDSYSYLHFPMVAGIVLIALGLKKTLGGVDEPLKIEVAVAMLGGAALYLLAHVASRLRNIGTLNRQRLLCALIMLALIPLATEIASLALLAIVLAVFAALIWYEAIRFAAARERMRHQVVED